MATLESLKVALRQTAIVARPPAPKQRLSDAQYRDGFEILAQRDPGLRTYGEFITPQLTQLLGPLLDTLSRRGASVLEIGPGPHTVLGSLPYSLRRNIARYTAFEPNPLFAAQLSEWLSATTLAEDKELPLPCLREPPDILPVPFTLEPSTGADEKQDWDVVLFCHSLYGLKPEQEYLERALRLLSERTPRGMVIVFHREGVLRLNDLVCHRVASFPGVVGVADDDATLDQFAPFLAGFDTDQDTRAKWRNVCRTLGRREDANPGHFSFDAPEIMIAFTQSAATALPRLAAQVPMLLEADRRIKSPEARINHPAAIVRPTEIQHIQLCIRWALEHEVGLTVMSGSHSAHCLRPNVVSVDMSAFDAVHIHSKATGVLFPGISWDPSALIIVEAGCNTGRVIRKTMEAGLTVPLGSRPSVGAGLWLQGGIGHIARLHGLACDAIIGAVVVDVSSGQLLCVGDVPSQHRPTTSLIPDNQMDILWAIKGAGTNFGIVVSVVFKAYPAPQYSVRRWVLPLEHKPEAQAKIQHFGELAAVLPRQYSVDAYLYHENTQLNLGVVCIGVAATIDISETGALDFTELGPEQDRQVVDGVGLFDTEMYMNSMNGGHGGGKTSAFKRCVFLKNIRAESITGTLVAAIEARPSPLCYLHLLQGGGKVNDVDGASTAFGCRDWDFACVVTGVWSREQDGTAPARAAMQWVYRVVHDLLPLSRGIYSADLGPDPRDIELASKAFGVGQNRWRLARLKHKMDPQNVLAYACPLPEVRAGTRVVILVTGSSGVGKDYSAEVWASVLNHKGRSARVVSISDETKREFAAVTGASLDRLLGDRLYKEQHREALTAFFQEQVRRKASLPEEHFQSVLRSAHDVDVLFITGMRDDAPVTTLTHLVPECKLLDVRVQASEKTRQSRKGACGSCDIVDTDGQNTNKPTITEGQPDGFDSGYRPYLLFENDESGRGAVETFAEDKLLPLLNEDLSRLYSMVRTVPDFPRPRITFRHVLNIAQQPKGLFMCTNLLMNQFHGDWSAVDVVVCCEAGGFVFASALAAKVEVPLALIREAGKLAPPTVSVVKSQSYISSAADNNPVGGGEKMIEMNRDAVNPGASVVVVDDVLATGKTLCTVLQLLNEAGVGPENVSILLVAEFPVHRGRELLRRRGYGSAHIHSLLVFDGV
ncbi:phosphoribosyl transferase domain protein [Apiospora arundinis]|uniref:Phosphoribosyl transferase domain protein n=1 Tax=Apiospora arundinis TaxID=335852 RepID=A0ABR2I9G7_9PEZI